MAAIRIPFLSRSEDGAPLQRCIDRVAVETGLSSPTVAIAMSLLLESFADEVAKGRAVRVPGFGMFAPKPIPACHLRISGDPTPRCKPVFLPARGFRAQVAYGAPPYWVEKKTLDRFEKNHGDKQRWGSARVFSSMQAMREQILAQVS